MTLCVAIKDCVRRGLWVLIVGATVSLSYSQTLKTPDDLIDYYLIVRDEYVMIAPPADEPYIQDMSDDVLAFEASSFNTTFLSGLVGTAHEGITSYLVLITEDPLTRERLIFNGEGELIWRATAPDDYQPTGEEQGINYPWGADDPARIHIIVRLMEEGDMEQAEENDTAVELDATESSLLASKLRDGGMMLDSFWFELNPVTNMQIVAVAAVSNNVIITIGYPDDFTNRLELYNFDSGDYPLEQLAGTNSYWSLLATNLFVSGTSLTYTNSGISASLQRRFYVAGNADYDSDGDGLPNAREIYLYHTSATTNDTDGDGISDGVEVLTNNTDPCNSDTNRPVITLIAPSSNYIEVWVP